MVQTEDRTAAFKEAYASLNATQKQAVDTLDGPVMVIAGPGTGKTQILTLRIANILLKTDTAPESILALTFTESGASAMRDRLHRYIGAEAYRVSIHTFHGFCGRLIAQYPDAYARIIGSRAATDIERFDLVNAILESSEVKKLRPLGNPSFYVQSVIATIGELKKEYVTPDRLAEIIQGQEHDLSTVEKIHQKGAHKGKVRGEYTKLEETIVKNKELLYVYRQYDSALRAARLYDYEDMILQTIDALLGNEGMLCDLQEQYQYVLADEHQDVNGSQNRILELLCSFHERPNLFVVGDEKQAIFRFQGASLENFLYFEDAYPNTQSIALTQNYRSGQAILNVAHSLVEVDEGPLKELRVPLVAEKKEKATIEMRAFSHQAIEDQWVVEQIGKLTKEGIPPGEIAVIVRTNREVEGLTALLRKAKIAAAPSSESDILEHPITLSVIALLRAAASPEDEEALRETLHGAYWGISGSDLFRVLSARTYERPLRHIVADADLLASLSVAQSDVVLHVAAVLEEGRKRDSTEGTHRVVEYLLQESGLLDYILTTDPIDGGRVVRRIYDEVENMVIRERTSSLMSVCRLFALHQAHGIPLSAPFLPTSVEAVQVMTAHKSKGLEFEVVILPHLHDAGWGGRTKRELFKIPFTRRIRQEDLDTVDDERRLLYVSLTRAKTKLYLSYAHQAQDGTMQLRSRLCDDFDETFIHEVPTDADESSFEPLAGITQTTPHVSIDTRLLQAHLLHAGLSPTALNNYLQSPYTYLYRNVLRVPEIQAAPLLFGTAIHSVMEWVSGYFSEKGIMPSPTMLREALKSELGSLPVWDAEFTQMHEKGFAALIRYIEHAAKTMPRQIRVEQSLSAMLKTGIPEFPEVKLTGKLDRIDLDGDGNVVQVVDYKTGSPKTRNVIEGKTKNSNGDYKRQLVFYALLLSLYDDKRYASRTCTLSFIEPDKNGTVHELSFTITDEEMEDLKVEIIRVVHEIVTGSFLLVPCNRDASSYCHLADQLAALH